MKKIENVEMLKEIVEIKSTSNDGVKCLEVLTILKEKLEQNNIPTTIETINGHPNLMAGEIDKATIMFLGHADVVEGDREDFKLKIKNDKMFGRGVIDMKGPLVISLNIFLKLWQNQRRNVLLVVTCDEEIGGFDGTAKLVNKFKKMKLAIVADGGSGEKIVTSQKAPFHITVSHNGKSCHASRPDGGLNSAQELAKCCLEIVDNLDCASITKIESGKSINQVPDIAMATLDIRINKKIELKNTLEFIDKTTAKFKCSWQAIDKPLFFEMDHDNQFISKFAKQTQRSFTTESGTSDARFLTTFLKIPVLVTSAVGGNIHGKNEWVDIESINKLQKDLFNFINSL